MSYAFKQCMLDFQQLANPSLKSVFKQGMAMFLLQDLAAPAVGILAAKAGNNSTSSWTTAITNPAHPRSVQVVFADGWDGGDITLTGYDQFGRYQTEVIADVNNSTVQGVKVWARISSVAKQSVGAAAATFTLQTGTDLVGLPVPLLGAWGLHFKDGVAEAATSWDATYHGFKPGTTPNGSLDFLVLVPVDWEEYAQIATTRMVDV